VQRVQEGRTNMAPVLIMAGAGLAVLILLALIVWLTCRRRRRMATSKFTSINTVQDQHPAGISSSVSCGEDSMVREPVVHTFLSHHAPEHTTQGESTVSCIFGPGPLGIGLSETMSADKLPKVVVTSISDESPAMVRGVKMHSVLVALNDESLLGVDKATAVAKIQVTPRPFKLTFSTAEPRPQAAIEEEEILAVIAKAAEDAPTATEKEAARDAAGVAAAKAGVAAEMIATDHGSRSAKPTWMLLSRMVSAFIPWSTSASEAERMEKTQQPDQSMLSPSIGSCASVGQDSSTVVLDDAVEITWTDDESVERFLKEHKLHELAPALSDNDINTVGVARSLSQEELEEIGISPAMASQLSSLLTAKRAPSETTAKQAAADAEAAADAAKKEVAARKAAEQAGAKQAAADAKAAADAAKKEAASRKAAEQAGAKQAAADAAKRAKATANQAEVKTRKQPGTTTTDYPASYPMEKFLKEHKLDELAPVLNDNDVDTVGLGRSLSQDEFEEIGISPAKASQLLALMNV